MCFLNLFNLTISWVISIFEDNFSIIMQELYTKVMMPSIHEMSDTYGTRVLEDDLDVIWRDVLSNEMRKMAVT